MIRYEVVGMERLGIAPCGATFGTAAGRNDGKSRCAACGEVHPVQVGISREVLELGVLTGFQGRVDAVAPPVGHVCDALCEEDHRVRIDHHTCPQPPQADCRPERPWCECVCHGTDEKGERP